MFKVESVNCICVDWKGGSRTTYTQATQNVRVVGAQVAYLANLFQVTDPGLHQSSKAMLPGFSFQNKTMEVMVGMIMEKDTSKQDHIPNLIRDELSPSWFRLHQ